MALAFHRRLAIPLWVLAFFAVALTTPGPATLSLIVVLGIAAIAVPIPELVRWLRASPFAAHVPSTGTRRTRVAATAVGAGACEGTPETPGRRTAEDKLDLVRMDDDGGWQMARPTA